MMGTIRDTPAGQSRIRGLRRVHPGNQSFRTLKMFGVWLNRSLRSGDHDIMFPVERRPHSIINRRTAHRHKQARANSSASGGLRGLHCPFVLRDGAKEAVDYSKGELG
jgi:hypothetical protein